jgi:hypothetical protein
VEFCPLELEFELKPDIIKFSKMPEKGLLDPITGLIPVGNCEEEYIPFAWFKLQRRLYFDLNRNYDLSDDPGGMFKGERRNLATKFACIKIELDRDGASLPYLMDLTLDASSSIPTCTAALNSLFHTRFTYQGKVWNLAIIDNLDGEINVSRGEESGDRLILRPENPGDEAFGSKDTIHLDNLALPGNIFINNTEFRLAYSLSSATNPVTLNATFTPVAYQPGTLWVKEQDGDNVSFMILEGDHPVLIDQPGEEVMIPPGIYTTQRIAMQSANGGPCSWLMFNKSLKLVSSGSDVFRAYRQEVDTADTSPKRRAKITIGKGVASSSAKRRRVRPARTSSG